MAFTPIPNLSSVALWSPMAIGPPPSGLITTVVTPCVTTLGAERRRASSDSSPPEAWEWRSMNPGVMILPRASMVRVAVAPVSFPTATILSPRIPTSAENQGLPDPSMTCPPVIRMSKGPCS